MHTYTHTRTRAHTHAQTHTYTPVYTNSQTHTHTGTFTIPPWQNKAKKGFELLIVRPAMLHPYSFASHREDCTACKHIALAFGYLFGCSAK